jgi:hypothetical protein
MRIIGHFPKNEEDIKKLQAAVAKAHADAILWKIQNLNCPPSQKAQILEGVIQEIAARSASSIHAGAQNAQAEKKPSACDQLKKEKALADNDHYQKSKTPRVPENQPTVGLKPAVG